MPDTPDRPVSPGEALDWSEEDLDAFTSPEALMGATDEIAQAWRRDADAEAGDLIDAPEAD